MILNIIYVLLFICIVYYVYRCYATVNTEGFEPCHACSKKLPCQCNKFNKFNKELIKVWVSHLLYTRLVCMAFLTDDRSLSSLVDRLLQNQKDIGKIMENKYGSEVGKTITDALVKHITIATAVLTAVKSNNKVEQIKSIDEFYSNANDIGIYLDKLLHVTKFTHHMKIHIKSLVDDVLAFKNYNYQGDIQKLDIYVDAGLDMVFDMI